ncbi:P-loop containing nucleoside triphosphate hydrolase protein [Mycena rosella]|uniref:P-loop containing nucleoside triphosphate hydrolase protein n=1 Tax=Mycena rosella TaxID=1033263 RepID=A0AAD7CW85_MYCRO|nr:P-loop containing nucleoside triphosphate hydrolase protein [Mycena rosella]
MLVYQLQISLALILAAVGSLAFLALSGPAQAKIQLPLHDDFYVPDHHDAFDVTQPEDLVDGYPMEEGQFWARMKRRKNYLCTLLAALLAIQVFEYSWLIVHGEKSLQDGVGFRCVLLALLLCLAILCARQVERHSEFIWHLTTLTTLPAVLIIFATILPDPHTSANDSSSSRWLGHIVLLLHVSLEIGDLPLMPAQLRATVNYDALKKAVRERNLSFWSWRPRPGSGATLAYQLFHSNLLGITAEAALTVLAALLYYTPPICLNKLIQYLEGDPNRDDTAWGWFWVAALFAANAVSSLGVAAERHILYIVRGQLWSLCSTSVKMQIRVQLNALLFAKTLVRKDVASFAPAPVSQTETEGEKHETVSSSKAQIMTLMTTDVSRVADSTWYIFDVIDAPIEIAIGAFLLYRLLGISSLIGLAVTCLFTPINNFATKVAFGKLTRMIRPASSRTQEKLMKARDERISLMNEVLGGIRMIKFMAWERNFEARVMGVREKELRYQKLTFTITVRNGSPMIVTLVSFWHFAVVRNQTLTPSIAFTSVLFNELKFALSALPNSYLDLAEISPVPSLERQSQTISFKSCTVTWPRDISPSTPANTPHKFILADLSLNFPLGELSLVCGKIGSGKSLLLLALLGEADVVAGQMTCPRSPPDSLASFADWVVPGMCAYVPQVSWLRNASIKENILFHLPYNQERYEKTLEARDLDVLEDGDESEIGELGVTLSGGQKSRDKIRFSRIPSSLGRCPFGRVYISILYNLLAAQYFILVDAHTGHHLYHACLKGELMKGRTVILVLPSHNGRVQFQGNREKFYDSDAIHSLGQSATSDATDRQQEAASNPYRFGPTNASSAQMIKKSVPRKLIEQEARAVGRVAGKIWATYIKACGGSFYWASFLAVFVTAALSVVAENGWLSYWSGGSGPEDPTYYINDYILWSLDIRQRIINTGTAAGLILTTGRWLVLCGNTSSPKSILTRNRFRHNSCIDCAVLFADIRFHDTSSRGRLLNRFGKDFEGILTIFQALTAFFRKTWTSVITISFVGGIPFAVAAVLIGILFYSAISIFVQTSRDVQRLGWQTQSPLYSTYSENIAILREMLRRLDTNSTAFYWTWGLNRWLRYVCSWSIRFDFLAGAIMCAIAVVAILNKNVSASMAGLRSHSATQRCLERVNEYCEVEQEPPEFIEPRPPTSWPSEGAIQCQNLVVRYAPELPAVLHNLTFQVNPGEKVGILGRTAAGKSTLALSFLRFVAPTEGRIIIDGLDISHVGLTDLRSKLTIIPQDPTLLSGSLRSTMDVFGEYSDAEIFEALRRVHLIPSSDTADEAFDTVNSNIFRSLDSPVSEGGQNFSSGEKQLLCIARAILKKVEDSFDGRGAFIDSFTDALISKTINQEFAESTILTIAHRIRSVVTYDRILLMDQGRIAEFDRPGTLLANPASKFYALCKAAGPEEFAMLRKMAGVLIAAA